MNVGEMTRKELEATPHRDWSESVEFEAMIILPGKARDLHDSGYRCMDFVAVKDNKPLCLQAAVMSYTLTVSVDSGRTG